MNTIIRSVLLTMIQLVIPVLAGVLLRRRGSAGEDVFRAISRVVVAVTLPLYFFVRVARTDVAVILGAGIFPVAAVLAVGIGLSLTWIVVRLTRDELAVDRLRIAAGGFGNSGYLPLSVNELLPVTLPVLGSLLNPEQTTLYIGAYVFMQSPLLWSVGNWLVQGGGVRFEARQLVSTPVIGILAGLVASVTGLGHLMATPDTLAFYLTLPLSRLGQATVPLVLLTLGGLIGGLTVPQGHRKRVLRAGATAVLVRLVLMPGVFWIGLVATFGGSGGATASAAPLAVLWVLFLEFHTPTANNLSVMAARAGRGQDEIAATMLMVYGAYTVVFPLYLAGFLIWLGV